MTNRKITRTHPKKEIIKCECGAEISLLYDVKAMGDAIEVHAAAHMKKAKDPTNAAEAERVKDALIAQVLTKVSQFVDE